MAEGDTSFEDLFTKVFYSYKMGCSKPEACSFQKVIDKTGLNPETCLFLDDSQLNLDAAQKMGFQTQLVTAEHDLSSIFTQKQEA